MNLSSSGSSEAHRMPWESVTDEVDPDLLMGDLIKRGQPQQMPGLGIGMGSRLGTISSGVGGASQTLMGFPGGPGPLVTDQLHHSSVPTQTQAQTKSQSGPAPSFSPHLQDEVFLQAWAETSNRASRKAAMAETEKQLRDAAAAEVAQKIAKDKTGVRISKDSTSGGGGSVSEKFPSPPPSGSAGKKRKLQMTAEEKAVQSRVRNREHARNTRLRNKAYVKKLKELIDDLDRQRKEESKCKEVTACKLMEQQGLRQSTVSAFLDLRSRNERDRSQWERVLDESFTLSLPITPYRYFARHEVTQSTRVVRGIDAAMADAASLKVMVEGLRRVSIAGMGEANALSLKLNYIIESEHVVLSKEALMCRWAAMTEGAQLCGALAELSLEGMMHCRFSSDGKLTWAELVFDVMNVMQQMQRATGVPSDALIVPNCLEAACQRSSCARVVCKAEPPFVVLHVNEQWTGLTGYTQAAVEGRPLDLLQGSMRGAESMVLVHDVSRGRPSSCVTVALKATGEGFMAHFQLFPLGAGAGGGIGPAAPTHLLGTLRELAPGWLPGATLALPLQQQQPQQQPPPPPPRPDCAV